MPNNIEIKAKVKDFPATQKIINTIADGLPSKISQWDTFFHSSSGRLKLRDFGNGKGELISYFRSDADGPTVSEYSICVTHCPADLRNVLAMTLGVRGEVKKMRSLYHVGRTRIHLDEVEQLGTFLELEVVMADEESHDKGKAEAADLLKTLCVSTEDLVSCAYVDLL